MTSRATIESVIREAYAARARGDLDGVMRHMAPDATFTIAGARDASPVTHSVHGQAAVREALAGLTASFEFAEPRIVTLLVEGDEAAVHWRVRVRSPATGREADTEIVDMIRFEGALIVAFRQFADTAIATWLLGGEPPR